MVVTAALCWKFWLFRTRVQMLGEIETVFHWRWGWAHQITVDADRDGHPEEIWKMAPYSRGFNCNYETEGIYTDPDGDGVYEKFILDAETGRRQPVSASP